MMYVNHGPIRMSDANAYIAKAGKVPVEIAGRQHMDCVDTRTDLDCASGHSILSYHKARERDIVVLKLKRHLYGDRRIPATGNSASSCGRRQTGGHWAYRQNRHRNRLCRTAVLR